MIDALIGGRLYAKAVQRTGPSGKEFTTCKILAATGDGEQLFCNVICFDESVRRALLALDAGDSVSVSGPLTVKLWTSKEGEIKASLSLVAHAVMSNYHVHRKREAMQPADQSQEFQLTSERYL